MKIGLIGAENSHSRHFCECLNRDKMYPGYEITHVYGGDSPQACKELVQDFGLTECATETELIEKAEAVVITYRKGSPHPAPALQALKAGRPVFNDKPFAASPDAALAVAEYADKHGGLLCGGSNLKILEGLEPVRKEIGPGSTVVISFAADPASEYEGFWFYGIHSVELCLELCGTDYQSVNAFANGPNVVAQVNYKDRQCIITTSPNEPRLVVSNTVNGATKVHDIAMAYQGLGPGEFVRMLQTKTMPRSVYFYPQSVKLAAAIIEAAQLA